MPAEMAIMCGEVKFVLFGKDTGKGRKRRAKGFKTDKHTERPPCSIFSTAGQSYVPRFYGHGSRGDSRACPNPCHPVLEDLFNRAPMPTTPPTNQISLLAVFNNPFIHHAPAHRSRDTVIRATYSWQEPVQCHQRTRDIGRNPSTVHMQYDG